MTAAVRRRDIAVVCAVLLVALGVRLWRLGAKDLWQDEAASLVFASQPLPKILTDIGETNPPLYYAILHEWIAVFGTSERALRFPSVIFGVLAVGLTGWIGFCLGGKRLGWLAMGLMAVMPMPVEYSQVARTYTLFLAASLASFGCLLEWVRTSRRKWAVGYVLSTIVMSYGHYYWVFNMLAQQLYLAWQVVHRRVRFLHWAGLSAAVFVGVLPWLWVSALQTVRVQRGGFWIPKPVFGDLVRIIRRDVIFGVPKRLVWCFIALAVLGLFEIRVPRQSSVAASGVKRWRLPQWNIRPARQEADTLLLLVLWLVCPLVIPFVWSLFLTPVLYQRYTIAATVPFALLIGRGILAIPNRLGRAVVIIALGVLTASSLLHYYAWEREAWRPLTAAIQQLTRAGDAIAIPIRGSRTSFTYYYRGHIPVYSLAQRADGMNAHEFDRSIREAISGHGRLWLILSDSSLERQHPSITEAFLKRCPQAQLFYQRKFPQELVLYGYDLGVDTAATSITAPAPAGMGPTSVIAQPVVGAGANNSAATMAAVAHSKAFSGTKSR